MIQSHQFDRRLTPRSNTTCAIPQAAQDSLPDLMVRVLGPKVVWLLPGLIDDEDREGIDLGGIYERDWLLEWGVAC